MKPGRPANSNTPHKIIVHATKGLEYAATKYAKTSKSGKVNQCYRHWGRLLDGKRFMPGTTYLYAEEDVRSKLIFPEGWDLSEINKLKAKREPGRVAYEADDVDRQYGATWFLDRVAEKTGLTEDVEKVFRKTPEMVDDVFTLAYYPFVDNLSYSQLAQWQREVKAPSSRILTSKAITVLTQHITEQHRTDLFACRAKRVGKDELCGVDSTSMSCYGFNLADIRWGRNKERLPLRQTVEVVVYSMTSHQPIYYKELPGNMPDCRTIELILKELRDAGFTNLILITDRGYESMKNLELYVAQGQKVITSVKVGGADVLEKIRSIDLSKGIPSGMTFAKDEKLYYKQFDMPYAVRGNGDNVIHAKHSRLNLYLDPRRRTEALLAVDFARQEQEELAKELVASAEPVDDAADLRQRLRFLNLTFDERNVLTAYAVNNEKIERKVLAAGFFASKSIGFECTALEAKDNYVLRDEQEKTFALQKGPLGRDRLRAWSETGRHGRMFICFIGLILASYVRSVYDSSKWLRENYDSIEAVLAEMRTIRCIEHRGRRKFVTPFVGRQLKICEIFGFEVPESCGPTYVSKRVAPPKRGRKPKAKVERQEV